MDAVLTQDEYRLMETRPRLLAQWFEQSRDNWKLKNQAASAEVKRFRDNVQDVQKSRQMWREKAEQALQEQQRLAEEVQQLHIRLDAAEAALEKKSRPNADQTGSTLAHRTGSNSAHYSHSCAWTTIFVGTNCVRRAAPVVAGQHRVSRGQSRHSGDRQFLRHPLGSSRSHHRTCLALKNFPVSTATPQTESQRLDLDRRSHRSGRPAQMPRRAPSF